MSNRICTAGPLCPLKRAGGRQPQTLVLGPAQTRTRRVAGGKGVLPFPLRGSVSLRSVKGRVVFSGENLHP